VNKAKADLDAMKDVNSGELPQDIVAALERVVRLAHLNNATMESIKNEREQLTVPMRPEKCVVIGLPDGLEMAAVQGKISSREEHGNDDAVKVLVRWRPGHPGAIQTAVEKILYEQVTHRSLSEQPLAFVPLKLDDELAISLISIKELVAIDEPNSKAAVTSLNGANALMLILPGTSDAVCTRLIGKKFRMAPMKYSIEQAPTPMLRQPEANVIDVLKEIDTKAPNLITDMKLLLNDVYAKVKELAELDGFKIVKYFDPKPSVELDFDSLFAICAYTYNYTNADGDAEEDSKGNLYWQMNNQLRKRGEERKAALELWGKYLYYLNTALEKMDSETGIHYRGYEHKSEVLENYKEGRLVQWGAFSSTSQDLDEAKRFINKDSGVIFRLKLMHGKSIEAFSFFKAEREILLPLSSRFIISKEATVEDDGFTYVDMQEVQGTAFIS